MAISSQKLMNPHGKGLAVIFPGWHGGSGFMYDRLCKRLVKQGWAVLLYNFNSQILVADEKMTEESFGYIQTTVAAEIDRLQRKYNYQKINLVGISIGSVALTMVTKKYNNFSNAILVTAGDDLAEDMWHGIMTQNFRRLFETSHVGISELDTDWEKLAPIAYAQDFKDKEVKMYLSLTDRVIHTKYQKRLAKRLEEVGAILSIKKTRTGHSLTIVRFCCFSRLPRV